MRDELRSILILHPSAFILHPCSSPRRSRPTILFGVIVSFNDCRSIPFVAEGNEFDFIAQRGVRRHLRILLLFVISQVGASLHAANFANFHARQSVSDRRICYPFANLELDWIGLVTRAAAFFTARQVLVVTNDRIFAEFCDSSIARPDLGNL